MSRFWGNFVSMHKEGRRKEEFLILRSATQAHRTKKANIFPCIHFRFYGSSGLLKSKIDESGSYLYEYDIYGRLVKAILPTGQAIGLQFNLTSQGAAIDVMKNGIMSEVVLVQDQLVSTFFSLFSIW